jgi:hypothetical protein
MFSSKSTPIFVPPLGHFFFHHPDRYANQTLIFSLFFYIFRVGRVAIISSPSLSGGGGEEKLTSQLVADWPTKLAVGWVGGGGKATRRGNLLR